VTPLAHLPRGSRGVVSGLPHPHGLAKRLCALGLTPGAEVCVVQNRGSGPLIVEVHGARLALGRGQADRVAVEPMDVPDCAPPADDPAEVAEVAEATLSDHSADR
jgi:ferrous iron transport protein A